MKSFSFKLKIWSLIGVLSLVIIVIVGISAYSSSTIVIDIEDIHGRVFPQDTLTSEVLAIQKDQMTLILLASTLTTEGAAPLAGELVSLYTNGEKKNVKEAIDIVLSEYDKLTDQANVGTDKLATFLKREDARKLLDEVNAAGESFITVGRNTIIAFRDGKLDQGLKMVSEIRNKHLGALRAPLTNLSSLTNVILNEKIEDVTNSANNSMLIGIIAAVISICSILLLSFIVINNITNKLLAIVEKLGTSATGVSTASVQIASASDQLSQATNEQAASIEETAASIEEINSMIKKNSENADYTASSSSDSKKMVDKGKATVDQMSNAMKSITSSTETMAEIVKVISQIDKKTKVINEIVTKTELLSFNASVEAARAGEHGKGFAVVAEEVGNLARMSGSAAEEISTLLESSTASVNNMVSGTKEEVEKGSEVTNQCKEIFEEIVNAITLVSNKAMEIAAASNEQTKGAAEIGKAMEQLDSKTQQNAATSKECASAAMDLSNQAQELTAIVEDLKHTIHGGNLSDHKETENIVSFQEESDNDANFNIKRSA